MMQDIPYNGVCPVCGADSPGHEPVEEEGRIVGTRWLCKECGAVLGGTCETVPEEPAEAPLPEPVTFYKVYTRSAPWVERGRVLSAESARSYIERNVLVGTEYRIVEVRQDPASGTTRDRVLEQGAVE